MRSTLVKFPIGIVNGRLIFPHRGSDVDNADDGGDKTEDDDGGNESEEDNDEDDDEKESKRHKDSGEAASKRAMAAMRRELRDLRKAKAEADDKIRAAELADKTEVERAKAEAEDAKAKADRAGAKLQETVVQLEIIRVSAAKKYNWADIEDVLNDKTLRKAIEVDDEGEVTGIEDALKDLAKRKPHFLVKETKSDSDDGKSGKTSRSGASFNGGSNNNSRQADREALVQKYPVLRNMVGG